MLRVICCFTGLIFCLRAVAETPKYGAIPLSFEENAGQVSKEASYLFRGSRFDLFVTKTGATIALRDGKAGAAVRLEVVGAGGAARVEGEGLLAGHSNYLRGGDEKKWVTGVRRFEKVRLSEVQPGVDMVWYANGREFEYDLVVKPGARPEGVRLRFAGANGVSLTKAGDLKIATAAGDLVQRKPKIWQGEGADRVAVTGRYSVGKDGVVTVEVGEYDRERELVIDPVVSYSTYLGGTLADQVNGIVVDSGGNAYVTGQTGATDFPTSVGAYSVALKLGTDAFVAKLNPAGTALVYSTFVGGSGTDYGNAIALDATGNAYVTGYTTSTDFPVTAGVVQGVRKSTSNSDVFALKLNPTGTALVFSTYLGGTSSQAGRAIQVDGAGNSFLAGTTSSSNFPVTPGAYKTSFVGGSTTGFVAELNSAGTQLTFATFLGGSGTDTPNALVLDSASNCYVGGATTSLNFPTTSGAFQVATANGVTQNGFVSEISADGSQLKASTYLGGNSANYSASVVSGMAIDAKNNVYVTGYTQTATFPTTANAFETSFSVFNYNGYNHGFVTKFNSGLSVQLYSTFLAGNSGEQANAIAVDASGNAYIAGFTNSANFPITPGSLFGQKNTSSASAFAVELNSTGSTLIYSTLLAGNSSDQATGIGIDSANGLYVAGFTSSADYLVTPGALQTGFTDTSYNGSNGFVTKLDLNSQTACTLSISPASYAAPLGGGTFSFAITTPEGCPWVVYTSGGSIVFNGPTHGFGNGTVSFSIASNAALTYTISATISVGTRTFSISQPAGSCTTPLFSAVNGTASAVGGLEHLSITIPSGCSYAASSTAPWISVTSGSPGSGSGSINYFIDRNDFGTRSGVLTIAGNSFTITQTGSGCGSSATVVSGNDPSGGSGLINLTTSSSTCIWKAYAIAPWIQLTTTSGSGSAVLGFIMAPNPGKAARSGQIFIAGQTLTVSESNGPSGVPLAYTVSALAGTTSGFSGDGGSARLAQLSQPAGVAFDGGGFLIADSGNNRVRKVDSNGIITTVAGNGSTQETNGILATSAGFYSPYSVTVAPSGTVFVLDYGNNAVRKISANVVTQIGSNSTGSYLSVAADASDNVYTMGNYSVLRTTPVGSTTVFAGSSSYSSSSTGDGGLATSATFSAIRGLAVDASGRLYIADGNRIRRIANGIITTVAGSSSSGTADGSGTSAQFNYPGVMTVDPLGNVLIGERSYGRIRRMTPDGIVTTIAGLNSYNYGYGIADGTPALSVPFGDIYGIAVDSFGNIAVSDSESIVRLLTPSSYNFCSFTLSQNSASAGTSGGTLIPGVATGSGCSWNSFSSASWITVATNFGIGPGGAGLQVAPNVSGAPRTATVVIAGQPFLVTQLGGQSISFASLPNVGIGAAVSLTATATSGLGVSFTSNTPAVCNVTGTSSITLTAGTCSISASQAGNAVVAAAPVVTQTFTVLPGLRFVAITPCRVLDTRNAAGPFGAPGLAGGSSRDFAIPNGACGVPATALAYSLNVAVVPTQGPLGYLTIWPAGQTQPFTATVNSDGRVKSNAAVVPAGTGGAISVFASNSTHVILDVNGYFVPSTTAGALAFYPITPCRIGDTRNANGALGGPYLAGGVARTIPVQSSACGVPAGAQAYSLNFAAVPRGALGFLTAYPTGQARPGVASLNATTGAVTANAAIVPAGTGGAVDVYASNDTDLVTDINGYFAAPGAGGLSFYTVTPCRVLDTRNPAGALPFLTLPGVNVLSSGCGVGAANAFVFNATAVPAGGLGYLTLWPSGTAQPFVSSLNAVDGAVTGNLAIVPGSAGVVSVFASNATHLVLDLFGYFAP